MNFKVITRNVGQALLVNALFMLLSLAVSVMNGYDEGFAPLLISSLVVLVVGFFPVCKGPRPLLYPQNSQALDFS